MRKRAIGFTLALTLLLLCGCTKANPQETEPPMPELPKEGVELWLYCSERRYNMDYEGISGYWSVLTDEYFGDDLVNVADILSRAKNGGFDAAAYDQKIEASRREFADKYGSDWHYELSLAAQGDLSARSCTDFAAELEELYDSICALTDKAAAWDEAGWSGFAESLGLSVDDARALVDAYSRIGDACHEAAVTSAHELTLSVSFTGSALASPLASEDTVRVYEVNGRLVTEMLIDSTISLINLVY